MTEECPETMQEFGSRMGRVIRFSTEKAMDLSMIFKKNTDYFVHNTELRVTDGCYRKLYQGICIVFIDRT